MARYLTRTIDCAELLPAVTRESNDIQEIMRIDSIELQELWNILIDIFNNQFIETMTAYGLTQWEQMLDITAQGTFDDRRKEILKVLYGLRPFTFRSFQKMLDAAYGAGNVNLELKNNKYELWFNLSATGIYKRNDIYAFSEPIVPKNLLIFFKNQKEVSGQIYIAGYVHVLPIVHIHADTGFSMEGLSVPIKTAGYVHVNKLTHI